VQALGMALSLLIVIGNGLRLARTSRIAGATLSAIVTGATP